MDGWKGGERWQKRWVGGVGGLLAGRIGGVGGKGEGVAVIQALP
ncbi:MAG: hypothetical protein ACO2PP_12590 [Thermocrinis sp.]